MKRLWHWLLAWLRPADRERYDLYYPQKRLIFHYFNGTATVPADPMTLYRKLVEQGVDMAKNLHAFHAATNERAALTAHDELVKQVNAAFNLKPFEEGGVTSIETLAIWDQFLKFIGWAGGLLPGDAGNAVPPPAEAASVAQEEPQPNSPPEPQPMPPPPAAEDSNAPVVITLDADNAALLGARPEDLSLLERAAAAQDRSAAAVPAADGCGTGT